MAPWNSADVASAPGVVDRKSAMTELLPAPNSVSSRAETAADSELASSQPPARQGATRPGSRGPSSAMRDDDGDQGDGTAEAVDERSPAAEHRDTSRDGVRVRRTIENGHSFCQAPMGCITHETALDCEEGTFVLGVDRAARQCRP